MQPTLETFLILLPLTFFAAFVDAIAGGGGLISLPAYLFAGMPIHLAYGTNKLAAASGTLCASYTFFRSGKMRIRPALLAVAAALIGSWMGAKLVLLLSPKYLQISLMVILPVVACFLLTRKKQQEPMTEAIIAPEKELRYSAIIGLAVGCYDGFFGPGTGTFLALLFTSILGYSMVTATANAKLINLASNVGALITYLFAGKVLFSVGIPCIISSVLGGYCGTKLALHKGSRCIRPMMTFVLLLLFGKIAVDFFVK